MVLAAPHWKLSCADVRQMPVLSCGGTDSNTRPLALLFCIETVCVAAAASKPELGARVGLFVVIPADVIVPTRALVQHQVTARV